MAARKKWDKRIDPIDYYLEHYEGLNPIQLRETNPRLYDIFVEKDIIIKVEDIGAEVKRQYEEDQKNLVFHH